MPMSSILVRNTGSGSATPPLLPVTTLLSATCARDRPKAEGVGGHVASTWPVKWRRRALGGGVAVVPLLLCTYRLLIQ